MTITVSMSMMNGKFLQSSLRKWRKMGTEEFPSETYYHCCCPWALLPNCTHEDEVIPKDVPKGHLVVYVGEGYKRFVIKITLLKHPLFKALLDQAKDEYGFTTHSKLCIPCHENIFLDVVRCCTNNRMDRMRIWLCLRVS